MKKRIRRLTTRIMLSNKQLRKFLTPREYADMIGVEIGKNCLISTKNFGGEPFLISIGNNVRIAQGVCFYTHGGIWIFRKEYPDMDYFGKIKIGNNCYIGEDAKILPGVTIKDNCIIGAGSIVSKSVPEGSMVAGNPAKYIGETSNFIKKIIGFDIKTKRYNQKDKINKLLSLDEEKFIKKEYIKKKK